MGNSYRFVKLLKNHLYPTYQLHAVMANDKTDPRDGLRLAALTTMHWLKSRLGEAAPEEWGSLPLPEDYLSATDDELPSFYLNQGFVVNIVSLPDRGMWSLQITEPDLGSDPGNPDQKRPPVPGRIIETNVAFQIVDKQLECGFKTVISDPAGMAPEAEVYRTTVVRLLMENPAFGLKQVMDIPMKPSRISSSSQIKTMLWLTHHEDNQIPTVIFTQPLEEKTVEAAGTGLASKKLEASGRKVTFDLKEFSLPEKKQLPMMPGKAGKDEKKPFAAGLDLSRMPSAGFAAPPRLDMMGLKLPSQNAASGFPSATKTETVAVDPAYDFDKFAYYTFSHCRTYILENGMNKSFTAQSGIRFKPGDIIVIYPTSLGGGERVIPYRAPEKPWDESIQAIEKGIKDYLKERSVDFGHVMFLSGVREHLLHLSDELIENAEAADAHFKAEIEQMNAFWKSEIAQKDRELEESANTLKRQKEYASRLEDEKTALRVEFSQEREKLQEVIEAHLETIAFLKRRYDQPKDYDGIEDWVNEHFSDRILLHPKAIARMLAKSNQCAAVDLVCDALDYLATDYWDMRYLQVPKEVALTRCAEKYGRPFEVKPTSQTTIDFTPGEYRIKYYRDAKGRETDSDLDYHLRVGNDSENLLRIYFLHDDAEKLIVIGSLPDHLRNVKIQ